MRLERSIGLVGLTFIALSGTLGSGWLIATLFVSQLAGPAGILSWVIGGIAMLLIALCFAEIGAMLPVAGGLARVPWYSHGNVVSAAVGWASWVGYATMAPIDVLIIIKYLGPAIPFVETGTADIDSVDLSVIGYGVAISLMALMVIVNAVGVRFFTTVNTSLTWVNVFAALTVGLAVFLADFNPENLTSHGFAPYGIDGIMAAVSTGGILFAFIGFRHAIDLAGEARNPERSIPLALIGSVVFCLFIYVGLQISFIGGIPPGELADGWAKVSLATNYGPFAAIAVIVGIPWLLAVIYGSSVISPFGAGLVATGSNARLAMALSRNGFFPDIVAGLSSRGVPLSGLIINLVVGTALLFLLDLQTLVALNGAAIVVSFTIGPITLYALRLQLPDRVRSFKVPAAREFCLVAFIVSGLLLYWSGWHTMTVLGIMLAVGAILFAIRHTFSQGQSWQELDLRAAYWMAPFLLVNGLISYLGEFGGGTATIPKGWDLLLVTAVNGFFFFWAVWSRQPASQVEDKVTDPEITTTPAGEPEIPGA